MQFCAISLAYPFCYGTDPVFQCIHCIRVKSPNVPDIFTSPATMFSLVPPLNCPDGDDPRICR